MPPSQVPSKTPLISSVRTTSLEENSDVNLKPKDSSRTLGNEIKDVKNTTGYRPSFFTNLVARVKSCIADFFSRIKKVDVVSKSQNTFPETVGARFKNIETNPGSQITVWGEKEEGVIEKIGLSANNIFLNNGQKLSRCQYPVSTDKDMSNYFRMLLQEKPTEVVVLASDTDLNKIRRDGQGKDLIAYFRDNINYQNFKVDSLLKSSQTMGNIIVKIYTMNINDQNGIKQQSITVKHMTNWPDFGVVDARNLLHFSREVQDNALIHCRAGAGRTGVLIGAKQLLANHEQMHLGQMTQEERKELVDKTIADMRNNASRDLVQGDFIDENNELIIGKQHQLLYDVADLLVTEKMH